MHSKLIHSIHNTQMLVNAFNILDTDHNSIGTGIYLGVSITDHSCTPNAVVTFNGTTLNMRSIEPLQRVDFSKIFISYVDLMDCTEQRRLALRQTYYFECGCSRCLDASQERSMNAAACPNPKCSEPLDLRAPAEPPSECVRCGASICPQHVQRFREVVDMTKSSIAEMQRTACESQYNCTLDVDQLIATP